MDQSILYCAFASAPFQTVRIEVEGEYKYTFRTPLLTIVKKKVVFLYCICVWNEISYFYARTYVTYFVFLVFYLVIVYVAEG